MLPDETLAKDTLIELIKVLGRHEELLTHFVGTVTPNDLLTISAFFTAAILSQRPDLEGAYEWIKLSSAGFHSQMLASYYEANPDLKTGTGSSLRIIVPSFPSQDLTNPKKVLH